ncbi:MAG TPA: ATP-dependent protease ATPase subunit HslU [Gemmatimonadales bacterium]|nr:ATP-dependent protease ATPase subunit HslU [Gemmatimonadales bacterium]
MAVPTPDSQQEPLPWLEELPPRQIVAELDRYIVGQEAAKKAIAIAVRNRWRRGQAPNDIRDEITPSNIILIGPTGVGKTEIARRLARLAGAPFIKVEASRFTEVGYVGRDVESMVRELVDAGITLVRAEREDEVYAEAEKRAEERLLDLLLPPVTPPPAGAPKPADTERVFVASPGGAVTESPDDQRRERSREKLRKMLKDGQLEDREVEVEVTPQNYPALEGMPPQLGPEGPDVNWFEMFQEMLPKRKKRRNVRIPEARRILIDEELKRLVDQDDVINESLDRVENHGIIFVDEIDKIAGERSTTGPDISREGVQRDLLPIVEGSTVQTRYGYVRTDHILFIAAGAFHVSKPSDLIPELQGRFPIRVELSPLNEADFVRIMTEPENALTRQYRALVGAEQVELEFSDDAIHAIARIAAETNSRVENIGARRLQTVMATLMEDLLFDLPKEGLGRVVIDAKIVEEKLGKVAGDDDLRRYIL